MKELERMGIMECVEPAPGAVLTALLRKNVPGAVGQSYATVADLEKGATA